MDEAAWVDDATARTLARAVVDSNAYMTLATADPSGVPWASPVWFAHDAYSAFLWVSRPEARHSRNIAARPEIGIVIFDSTVPEGAAQAVYLEATAARVEAVDLDRTMATFSGRSVARGGEPWTVGDVSGDAPHRLYCARPSAQFVLSEHDARLSVEL